MQTLDYYFDFLSPYSYLCWMYMKKFREEWDQAEVKMNLYPVTLATVIHHYETKGPAEIEPKRLYLFKDCLRFSAREDIPFSLPAELPFNSLYALRCALFENAGDDQEKVIDCLFKACWGEGRNIGDSDVVLEVLNQEGLNGERLLEQSMTKEIRKALKNNVKKALEAKVFGLPTFIIGDELFWGNDSLPFLNNYIFNKDTVDPQMVEKFQNLYSESENG